MLKYSPTMAIGKNELKFEGRSDVPITLDLRFLVEVKQRAFSSWKLFQCRAWNRLDKPNQECKVCAIYTDVNDRSTKLLFFFTRLALQKLNLD